MFKVRSDNRDQKNSNAYAKINLFLNVRSKREDGYHLLKSVFQPLDLYDTITVKETETPGIKLKCDSEAVPLNEKNTAHKAAERMAKRAGKNFLETGVEIEIKKRIPMAGGLGGSAVDAAPVIIDLNKKWNMGMTQEDMILLGANIGADVSQAIVAQTGYMEGIGEILKQTFTMPSIYVCIAEPHNYFDNSSQKTKMLFEVLDSHERDEIDEKPMLLGLENHDWKEVAKHLYNDFEIPAFMRHPELKEIRDVMIAQGALGALLCGSGGCIFGLFDKKSSAENASNIVKENKAIKTAFVTKTKS